MATTTNFGWETPDDTDLVKDGAAAIRTALGGVDTSFVDLKGGTTGQILSKASNTDLDYTWTAAPTSGLTLISTTTLTGATVDLTSIPSTYVHLQLVIQNFKPSNDGAKCRLRLNNNAGTVYRTINYGAGETGVAANDSVLGVHADTDNSVSSNLAIMNIFNYANSSTWKVGNMVSASVNQTTNTQANVVNTSYVFYDATAISSIRFFPDSGNFTSGTVLLYGVK